MKSMLMFVYNDLKTDARVQRSLDTLSQAFEITIISTGEVYEHSNVHNVILKSKRRGSFKFFDIIKQANLYAKNKKFEYLYLHDYYSCLLGLWKYKGHKTIYDAHELIIGTKEYPVDKREKFFGFFEKLLLPKTQLVICADDKRAELMQKHYGLKNMPFTVPNFSELSINTRFQFTPEMIEFFKDPRKTFVYAGALTSGRHIDSIILETSKLSDRYKVLIIGDGGERENLQEIAGKCEGLKYLFTGSLPYKDLGALLSHCDVGYLSYPLTNLNNIYCAPNKIYEYASVELPMVCNDNPNLINIVGKNQIGLCVSDKGGDYCCNTIEAALTMIDRDYDKYKESIRLFQKKNSWSLISKQYLAKVQSI